MKRWLLLIFIIIFINGCAEDYGTIIESNGTLSFNSSVEEEVIINETMVEPVVPKYTISPFLWRIEGTNSYLYGTMHLPNERIITIPAKVRDLILNSDAVYIETTDYYSSFEWVIDSFRIDDGKTLQDLISPDMYGNLDNFLMERGESILKYMDLKPVVISEFISLGETGSSESLPSLDSYIKYLGERYGKEVYSIEFLSEHYGSIENFTMEEGIFLLNATIEAFGKLREESNNNYSNYIVDDYISGNMSLIYKNITFNLSIEESIESKMDSFIFLDRDIIITKRVDELISSKPNKSYFIAIGVGHFLRAGSVIDMLEEKGYVINRVKLNNGEICKNYEFEENGLCYFPYDPNFKNPYKAYKVKPYSCNERYIEIDGEYLGLSWLINLIREPLLIVQDFDYKKNSGVINNIYKMNIENYDGIMTGYIIFKDKFGNKIVDDGKLEIVFYELKDYGKEAIYTVELDIQMDDFRRISYLDQEGEEIISPAYVFRINLNDFSIKPNECLGWIDINFIKENNVVEKSSYIEYIDKKI